MKFEFSTYKIVDRFSFDTLSEIEQQQFVIAGGNAVGGSDAQVIFERCEPDELIMETCYAKDSDTGDIVYDVWLLGADAGTVFEHNTTTETFIEYRGDSFCDTVEAGHDSDARAKIADALTEAEDEANHLADDDDAWMKYWEDFEKKMNSL